jgi:hypothetical protein
MRHAIFPRLAFLLVLPVLPACSGEDAEMSQLSRAQDSLSHDAMADGRPPRTPPPEAFAACNDLLEGAACTVKLDDHEVAGKCIPMRDSTELVCTPKPMGPPPVAVEACASLADGAACRFVIDGKTLESVCRKGPNGEEPLACAPPPPPGPMPPPAD